MPPIVLRLEGNESSLPFSNLDQDELSKTWRVCTKVKDSLENGSRLENLSWRLWFMQNVVFANDIKTSFFKSKNPLKQRQPTDTINITEQYKASDVNQKSQPQPQLQKSQQQQPSRIDIVPSSATELPESVLDYSLDDIKPLGTENFVLNQFTSDQDDDQIIELKDIFPSSDMQEFMYPILDENPTTTNSVAQFTSSNSSSSNNSSTSPSFIPSYYNTTSPSMAWEPTTTTTTATATMNSESTAIYGNQSNNRTMNSSRCSNNNEAMTYSTNLSPHFMPAVSQPVTSTSTTSTTAINNSNTTTTRNNYNSTSAATAVPKPNTSINAMFANQIDMPSINIPCYDENGNLNSNITSAALNAQTQQPLQFPQEQQDFIVNYNNAAYVAAAAALTTIPNATLHNKLLATLPPKTLASAERLLSPARYAPLIPLPTRTSMDSTLQQQQQHRPSSNFLAPNYNNGGYDDHLQFMNSSSNNKHLQTNNSRISSHSSTESIAPPSSAVSLSTGTGSDELNTTTHSSQPPYYNVFRPTPSNNTLPSTLSTSNSHKEYSPRGSSIKSNTDSSRSTSTLPVVNPHASNDEKVLICSNCEATSTPLWRRSTDDKILCNACGLYYKLHKAPRPKHMKKDNHAQHIPSQVERMDIDNENQTAQRQSHNNHQHLTSSTSIPTISTTTTPRPYHRRSKQQSISAHRRESLQDTDAEQSSQQIVCSNCKTTKTPLWRRDVQGAPLCNACGLYLKLHNEMRPLSMKTDVIKKRQRTESLITSAVSQDNLKKPRYYDQKALFSARNSDGSLAPAYKNAVTSLPGTGILMMTTNVNSNKTSSSSATTSTSS